MRQARGKGASLTPMSTRCCRWSDLDGQRHAINQRWRSPFEPCGWRRTSEVRRASAGDLRSGGVGRCGQPGLGAMAAIRNGHGPRWRARRRRRLRRLSLPPKSCSRLGLGGLYKGCLGTTFSKPDTHTHDSAQSSPTDVRAPPHRATPCICRSTHPDRPLPPVCTNARPALTSRPSMALTLP